MRKNLTLVLAVCLLLICMNGCSVNNETVPTTQPTTEVVGMDYKDPDAKVIILHRNYWSITPRYLGESALAGRIITALKALEETGEISPKISDDKFLVGSGVGPSPAELETLWLEIGNEIYRMTPDLSQICRVESHYGEGKVLTITEDLKTDVYNAYHYYPYDYYLGEYHQGDETVALEHVFEADSTVKLSIKDIKVEKTYNSKNTITIELISSIDQELTVCYESRQSDDVLRSFGSETVVLKKDVPATLEISFSGTDTFYRLYLTADNTEVDIAINP